MKRRDFIRVLGGMAMAWLFTIEAQPATKPVRIGFLVAELSQPIQSMRDELKRLGYRDGDLHFEYRFAAGQDDRYPELAKELVTLGVDVIVTWGSPPTLAAMRATTTIPIVTAGIGDPSAIVSNLARPGGNLTGFSTSNIELEVKRLELLKELLPQLSRLGVLTNATNPYSVEAVRRVRRAAESMGLMVEFATVQDKNDVESSLLELARARPDAVLVVADTLLRISHKQVARFTTENHLPAIFPYREYAEAGGLMAYATDYNDLFRRAADYVDKILKGARPGDLPIQQAGKFELVINLKTAQALGLTIPPALLARADEVIE
jgi:putative ABC transport system substrate-binding protein